MPPGLLMALGGVIFGLVIGCGAPERPQPAPALLQHDAVVGGLLPAPNVPGDPVEGRRLFSSTGCDGCHTSADIPTAAGIAGPNLSNVVLRPTLAGEAIPMTPDTLAAFLATPSAVKPGTTMPDVGLTADEARHIAAFLYSQPHNPPR